MTKGLGFWMLAGLFTLALILFSSSFNSGSIPTDVEHETFKKENSTEMKFEGLMDSSGSVLISHDKNIIVFVRVMMEDKVVISEIDEDNWTTKTININYLWQYVTYVYSPYLINKDNSTLLVFVADVAEEISPMSGVFYDEIEVVNLSTGKTYSLNIPIEYCTHDPSGRYIIYYNENKSFDGYLDICVYDIIKEKEYSIGIVKGSWEGCYEYHEYRYVIDEPHWYYWSYDSKYICVLFEKGFLIIDDYSEGSFYNISSFENVSGVYMKVEDSSIQNVKWLAGTHYLACYTPYSIYIYDIDGRKKVYADYDMPDIRLWNILWNPKMHMLVYYNNNSLRVCDVDIKSIVWEYNIKDTSVEIEGVKFSTMGDKLGLYLSNSTLLIYDLKDFNLYKKFSYPFGEAHLFVWASAFVDLRYVPYLERHPYSCFKVWDCLEEKIVLNYTYHGMVELIMDNGTLLLADKTQIKGILTERIAVYSYLKDNDIDGMDDEWEERYGLDALDPSDADRDVDGDGLTNLEEYLSGSDPLVPDNVPPTARAQGYLTVVSIIAVILIALFWGRKGRCKDVKSIRKTRIGGNK